MSAEATEGSVNDCPVLPHLVDAAAARGFQIAEVSADKGYLANYNLEAIERIGAVPYVPFKSNSKGEGPEAWRRLWMMYTLRKSEFLAHYHQRSNVESCFSMVKRKLGHSLRAKLPHAQFNEALLKILVHNVIVLVHSMYELGIDPQFPARTAQPVRWRTARSAEPRPTWDMAAHGRRAFVAMTIIGSFAVCSRRSSAVANSRRM